MNGEFVATISEAAGFKTGVALDKPQLINLFPNDSGFKDMLSMGDESVIRIHSSDIDELFMQVLYHLGNVIPLHQYPVQFACYINTKMMKNCIPFTCLCLSYTQHTLSS